jgi:hypothetical protein
MWRFYNVVQGAGGASGAGWGGVLTGCESSSSPPVGAMPGGEAGGRLDGSKSNPQPTADNSKPNDAESMTILRMAHLAWLEAVEENPACFNMVRTLIRLGKYEPAPSRRGYHTPSLAGGQ